MKTSNIQAKSLRERLKVFTQPFHDELESTSLATQLSASTIDKKRYINYLQALYEIHKKIENLIKEMEEFKLYDIDPNEHSRLHLIEKDLQILGASPKALTIRVDLNVEWSFSSAVGVLYVLEGSTMGGRLLAQRLKHMCNDEGLRATCYFEAYKDETLKLWKKYCEFIDSYDKQNPKESPSIILGACDMFLLMLELMHADD